MILALLSAFFFSFVIIVDKYILSNKMKDSFAYFYLMNIVGAVLYPAILMLQGTFIIPINEIFSLVLFSVIAFATLLVYYYALKSGDVSMISPLLSSGIIFVMLFSVIFLSEWYGLIIIAFILTIILGAVMTTVNEKMDMRKILSFNKVFWLIMIANLLNTISLVIIKLFLQSIDGFNIIAWRQIIWLPLLLILFPIVLNRKRIHALKNEWKSALPYTALSAAIIFLSLSFMYSALHESVQIASALSASSGLFTVIISFIVSRIKPELINERHKRSVYIIRAVGAIMIFIGVAGIFLSR